MPARLCCYSTAERPGSSETLNARLVANPPRERPGIPLNSHTTNVSPQSILLDGGESLELRKIFNISKSSDDLLPDPRLLAPSHGVNGRAVFRCVRRSPKKLARVIRGHWLSITPVRKPGFEVRGSTSSPQQGWTTRPHASGSGFDLELLSTKSPSQGGFDPDARPLLGSTLFPRSPENSDLSGVSEVRQRRGFELNEHGSSSFSETSIAFESSQRQSESVSNNTNPLQHHVRGSSWASNIDKGHSRMQSSCYSTTTSIYSGQGLPENLTTVLTVQTQSVAWDNFVTTTQDNPHQLLDIQPVEEVMSQHMSSSGSVHLQNMRISQHLRSMSSFSDGSVFSRPDGLAGITGTTDVSQGQYDLASNAASIDTAPIVPKDPAMYRANQDNTQDLTGIKRTNDSLSLADGETRLLENISRGVVDSDQGGSNQDPGLHAFGGNVQSEKQSQAKHPQKISVPPNRLQSTTASTLLENALNEPRVDTYDGPADQLPELFQQSAKRRLGSTARQGSVAESLDNTAMLWGRAMTTHFDRQNVRRPQSRTRSSASGKLSRKESKLSDLDPLQQRADRSESVSQSIDESKPTRTEDSFSITYQDGFPSQPSCFLMSGARPFVSSADRTAIHDLSSRTPPLGVDIGKSPIAPTVPRGVAQMNRTNRPLSTIRESRSSLKAWARFPSTGWEERNGSAGASDHVIVRDFAPSPTINVEEDDTDKEDRGAKQIKEHKKRKMARMKNFIWRAKLLPTWPGRFIQRNNDFHQRQAGHRTSIDLAGDLEYPELELIPGSDVHLLPDWNETFGDVFGSTTSRSASADRAGRRGTRSTGASQNVRDVAPLPCEGSGVDDNSDPDPVPRKIGWRTFTSHLQHPAPLPAYSRRMTEMVSPLDGQPEDSRAATPVPALTTLRTSSSSPDHQHLPTALDPHSSQAFDLPYHPKLMCTSTISLPLLNTATPLTPTTDKYPPPQFASLPRARPKLHVVASLEELRKSTHDLRKMLKGIEILEAVRAVDAAGGWDV